MIQDLFYKASSILFFFLTTAVAHPQQTTVKASVDRNKILVGEQIRLTLQADIPENELIRFFTIDTIPHFDIVDRSKADTSNTRTGTFIRQTLLITSFDSGHWVIPPLVLGDKIETDSIPVDVGFSEFDPNKDYHDIRDIIEVESDQPDRRPWLWYAISGAALVLAALVYWLTRKKKPVKPTPVATVNPFEEAMKELETLRTKRPGQKEYYSRLVEVFRVYIYRKKGIHSLQQTTDDLVLQLKGVVAPGRDFERLSEALRLTDLVKFAKYSPAAEEDQSTFDVVRGAIQQIEQQADVV
jgi:hypothetical protein